VKLYHRTYAAEAILRDGFHDSKADFLTLGVAPGVWVTDRPLDEQNGALGNVVLAVCGVPEAEIAAFEWHRSRHPPPFRQFVIPAGILNRYPIVGIYPDSWLWISGEFEYVGSLIDMRPLLARAPPHDDAAADEDPARVSSPLQDHAVAPETFETSPLRR
jgi:hypothetical protein